MSFKAKIEERINGGLSKVYPKRIAYSLLIGDYIFFNHTCTVYIRSVKTYVDMEPELFQELLQSYWNESKNNLYHKENTVSYNNETVNEEGSVTEFFNLFEDENAEKPEEEFFDHHFSDNMNAVIDMLTPVQAKIIRGYYFEKRTEKEISEALQISQQRVHYQKAVALNRLNDILNDNLDIMME